MSSANTGDDFEHLGLSYIARYRHGDVHAGRRGQPANSAGAARDESWYFMETLGSAGRRDVVSPRRSRSCDAHGTHAAAASRRDAVGDHARAVPRLGIAARMLPMSDDPVRTRVRTKEGWLDFQPYFVRHRCEPAVHGWHSPAPPMHARSRNSSPRSRTRRSGGGDLPVQSVHQHRADPRGPGVRAALARLRRAGRRRLADHRRPRGKRSDREDDGGAWDETSAAAWRVRYDDLIDGYMSITRTWAEVAGLERQGRAGDRR